MWIIPSLRYLIPGDGFIRHYKNSPGGGCLQVGRIQFDYYGITAPRISIVALILFVVFKISGG